MAYLPHIYPVGATFFISFRLADSLPQVVLDELKISYARALSEIDEAKLSAAERDLQLDRLRRRTFGKYEHQLDTEPYGACHLSDTDVAQIICDRIFGYENQYYTVHALSIMPNHVHMLLDTSLQVPAETSIDEVPKGYVDVPKWMQLIKGGSAFLINKQLGRSGTLWAGESYDHYVRYDRQGEYERIRHYILSNPIVAGLGPKYQEAPYMYSINLYSGL